MLLPVDTHFAHLVVFGLGSLVVGLVGNFIYNVYFHPLSSHPGPKLWAGTRLVSFYHALKGDHVWQVKKLHEKYGPVVRVAPTELSYTTGTAWKTIYGHRKIEMSKPMDGRGGALPEVAGGASLLTANREDHSRMRRLVAHAFSEKALREQESYIQKYAMELVEALRRNSESGAPQDMVKWFNFTTFEVIGDLAFGEPFGSLQTGKYHVMMSAIIETVKNSTWYQLGSYYNISQKVQAWIFRGSGKGARVENARRSAEKMDRRLAIEEDRKDFTSYMLRYNDEKGLSLQELRNMSPLLLIAGSETTATLLSGLTYYLLQTPRVYEKLCNEVRERFKNEDEITMGAVNALKYMQAVLEEGLRIYPPVPSSNPRKVPAAGEVIDGKWVPPGTAVGVHQFSTYQSETNFHRASEFIPERWLGLSEGGSAEFARDDKSALQPFHTGPRNCIGKNLAYAEMRIILSRLLYNFDLELESPGKGWEIQAATFIWAKKPLMVKLTPRVTG